MDCFIFGQSIHFIFTVSFILGMWAFLCPHFFYNEKANHLCPKQ